MILPAIITSCFSSKSSINFVEKLFTGNNSAGYGFIPSFFNSSSFSLRIFSCSVTCICLSKDKF